MARPSVSHLFNKFSGKEISPPQDRASDPVIKQMEKVARAAGLKLRVKFPGYMYTQELRTDRVNAYAVQGPDGKWRISNTFSIG